MKRLRNLSRILLVGVALAAWPVPSADAADQAVEFDQSQSLYAQRWVEAFQRLDARNNITMVISNRDSLYELEHVVEIEAHSRFLVVRCQPPGGKSYRALVYPGSILLIKESPNMATDAKTTGAKP